ncbi:MAG: amino acid permease [Bacteroidetes bacterium]|nr:amino acid permease [Bacteroidota bacterium]
MTSPQLDRTLGVGMVVVVAVSNIIGSGVYKKIAPMAGALHSSGWVLICWILAGIISLFGALSNAEVAGLLADTGGEYVYYKKIYNRFFSFIFGWSLFAVIQTASISSLAYIFSQSLNSMVHFPPLFASWADFNIAGVFYPFQNFTVKLVAILLIFLLTWINSRGIKTGAWISTVILSLVIAGILTVAVFGLSSSESHISNIFDMKTSGAEPVGFSAVFTAMLAAFWAYQGWAVIGYIGGEVKNPKRNLPIGIAVGVFMVIFIYLLINITYLSLLPIPKLEEVFHSQNEIAAVEAVKVFWGSKGALLISTLIALTTLGATHATVLVSCRPYYAMAREGYFFKQIGKLNKHQAPANSLWLQGTWACVLVLSGSFDQLTDMIIFAVFIYYGATTLGVFILRKKMPDAPRYYKVWGYPVVPAIVILFSAALLINTFFARPREAAIGTVLMLTGVPLYFWFKKKAGELND